MNSTPAQLAKRAVSFNRLGPIAKRRTLARDVLARLKAGQIDPEHYGYCNPRGDWDHIKETDLRTLVDGGTSCEVCALGGAVVSLAHFEDNIRTNDLGRVQLHCDTKAQFRIIEVLGTELAGLIELTYEGYDDHLSSINGLVSTRVNLTAAQKEAGRKFYKRFKSPKTLFKAIWTQVAKTGTFDPAK